jgi:cytochrome oxidase Cu insertion factor (SCO1/SenC/PrrC family)
LKLLRNKLVLVALVCAAPFVLGTAAYLFGWSTGTTSNYGELIAPRAVPARPLAELRGKWVLVSFDAPACDAYCEKKLYFMRQVRRAQGKDMDRVERLWVLTAPGKPRAELLPGIEGTRFGNFTTEGFPGDAVDHIYLVDPLGNLMLRFPRDPDPSRMIKDLQRLLKYSRAG